MTIKAILLDLDGTTLKPNKINISPENQAAIKSALQRGIKVIPCTGRVLDMFPADLENIKGIEYAVTCHGGRVLDLTGSAPKSLYQNLISVEKSVEILEIIENKGIYCEVAAANTIYMEKEIWQNWKNYPVPAHHVWYLEQKRGLGVDCLSRYFKENGLEINKVNIYGMAEALQADIYQRLNATGAIRHTNEGVGPDLEFSAAAICKKEAVQVLLRHLNILPEEAMIIGDSSSDVELIRWLGWGVAMGNAPDWIKQDADSVTLPCQENGVAAAINQVLEG